MTEGGFLHVGGLASCVILSQTGVCPHIWSNMNQEDRTASVRTYFVLVGLGKPAQILLKGHQCDFAVCLLMYNCDGVFNV